jgi:hypothetical protein
MQEFDAILIPGGGIGPGGVLPPWTLARLDHALAVRGASPILLLSAGTTHHPPPLNAQGYMLTESLAAAQYLQAKGVPREALFVETASWDTIGNAWFARTSQTDPAGWRRLLIITSEFHMARTQAIFDWVFGLDNDSVYELSYVATADCGLSPTALAAGQAREAASLANVLQLAQQLRTREALHHWLFTTHAAYAVCAHDEAFHLLGGAAGLSY